MKFSKKELQNKASQIADRYAYPDDDQTDNHKRIVADKFYRALLHIVPDITGNTLLIYKTNPEFSTVISQLEELDYFFPPTLQVSITKNNQKVYPIKKQAIAAEARNTDYLFNDEASFSEDEYESNSPVTSDFLESITPSEKSSLPISLVFPPKLVYRDAHDLSPRIMMTNDNENYSHSSATPYSSESSEADTESDSSENLIFSLEEFVLNEQAYFKTSDTPENSESDSDTESDTLEKPVYPVKQLKPDEKYTSLFEELSHSGTPFLCGGAVIDLITGESKARDKDFVLLVTDMKQLQLPPSFIKDNKKKKNNSYFRIEPSPVDIRVLEVSSLTDTSWMHKDAANRDFNICKLYINQQFCLFDPTNKGCADISACALSMDGHEPYKLSKSPARIIRGIKYMMREYSYLHFKPDNALINALQTFAWLNPLKKNHLYTTTRHLLANSDVLQKEMLLGYLKKYALTFPLFKLDNDCTLEMLIETVREKPSPHSFYAPKKQMEESRVNQEETLVSNLSIP